MSLYRRRTLDRGEAAIAFTGGLAAGLAVGYLTRLWLGRSRLDAGRDVEGSPGTDRGPVLEETERHAPEPTAREEDPGR